MSELVVGQVQVMATTWFEQGRQEGRQQGQLEALVIQLEERFGSLSAAARQRLENLPADRLQELIRKVLTTESLKELGLEDGNGAAAMRS